MTSERGALEPSYAFADASAAVPASRRWLRLLQNRALGVGAFLGLLALFFAGLAPNFATVANLNTIVLNATILVVVACAEAIVVITRNYDLSVGSTVALASYVGLDVIRLFPQAGPVLILVPVAIGALCGVVNGLLVAYGRLPSVIATLGTLSIFRGLAFVYANGRQINAQDLPAWVGGTASSHVFGVSTLVIVAVAVVRRHSLHARAMLRFGRQIYAIGSNPEAAVFYGLNARAVVFRAYVVTGTLTGLAAYLFAARSSWIVPYLAQGLELTALAAVVIGGVSVLGGSGTVVGAAHRRPHAGDARQWPHPARRLGIRAPVHPGLRHRHRRRGRRGGPAPHPGAAQKPAAAEVLTRRVLAAAIAGKLTLVVLIAARRRLGQPDLAVLPVLRPDHLFDAAVDRGRRPDRARPDGGRGGRRDRHLAARHPGARQHPLLPTVDRSACRSASPCRPWSSSAAPPASSTACWSSPSACRRWP